nr:MAG: DNA pilot protein [Microvirus sp.]
MAVAIAAALGAAAIGGWLSNKGAKDRNKEQVQEARRKEAFQERMSSTAYQRSMDDMRKAGLNPILAYSQGGASTPQGAEASIEDTVAPAVSSAKQGLLLKQELDNMRAREELDRSSAQKERMDGYLKGNQMNLVDQQLLESRERTKFTKAQSILAELQAPSARNAAAAESGNIGKFAPYIERILRMAGGAARLKKGR